MFYYVKILNVAVIYLAPTTTPSLCNIIIGRDLLAVLAISIVGKGGKDYSWVRMLECKKWKWGCKNRAKTWNKYIVKELINWKDVTHKHTLC